MLDFFYSSIQLYVLFIFVLFLFYISICMNKENIHHKLGIFHANQTSICLDQYQK